MPANASQKPFVVVVGLKRSVARAVAERCGAVASLRFIDGERAAVRFPRDADLVIFSRFVPHRASVAAAGLNRRFCRGGCAAICAAVLAYALGHR